MPKELQGLFGGNTGAGAVPNQKNPDGSPVLDAEGGTLIQPDKGFVVKTKDRTGAKIFINFTKHELIDPFEETAVPLEQ
jgi:hypothetical protein